jgi:hypothetical protein
VSETGEAQVEARHEAEDLVSWLRSWHAREGAQRGTRRRIERFHRWADVVSALLSERVEAEAPDQRAEQRLSPAEAHWMREAHKLARQLADQRAEQAAREERLRERIEAVLRDSSVTYGLVDDNGEGTALMTETEAIRAALPTPDPSQDVDAE